MSELKCVPGPYRQEADLILAGENIRVATALGGRGEIRTANANLLAASWDLYRALEGLLFNVGSVRTRADQKAIDALAKAQGSLEAMEGRAK